MVADVHGDRGAIGSGYGETGSLGTLVGGFADFPDSGPAGSAPELRQGSMRFQRLLTYVLILSMALPLPAQFGPPKPPPGSGSSSWGITLFPFTLVLIPLLIAWAVDHCSRPNGIPQDRRRGSDPVLIALLCLIAAATVSVIATHADWRHVSLWVSLFALFAFARYRMPRIIGRGQLAVALCCVMGVLAVISGIQLVTGRPVGAVATFFQHEVRSAQVFSGKGGGSLLKRVQATFFSTDVFAMFLLFVALWFVGVSRTVKSRFVTLTMLGCGVLIALTFSRGVWLATLVTVPLLMIALIRRRQLALSRLIALSTALLVVVALAFVFAAGTVFARVSSSQVSRSAQTRDERDGGCDLPDLASSVAGGRLRDDGGAAEQLRGLQPQRQRHSCPQHLRTRLGRTGDLHLARLSRRRIHDALRGATAAGDRRSWESGDARRIVFQHPRLVDVHGCVRDPRTIST